MNKSFRIHIRHAPYLFFAVVAEKLHVRLFPDVSLRSAELQYKGVPLSVPRLSITTALLGLMTRDRGLCAASATAAILETIAVRAHVANVV